MKKLKEVPQKLNFFATSFLSVGGFALAFELVRENDLPDKIDDALFVILAISSIFWYRKNATKKTIMPVVLVGIGVLIKIMAIIIEHADAEAMGDDIGFGLAILFAFLITVFQYRKLRKSSK